MYNSSVGFEKGLIECAKQKVSYGTKKGTNKKENKNE